MSRRSWISVTLLFFSLISVNLALAANLKLSPTGGYYQVGDNVTVTAQIVSPEESTNAIYGVINFPTNKLQVTSISKTGSVVNLWVQEPTYSNSTGQITFEGAILNPGFTGEAGRIITINFKAKNAGQVSVSFSDGSILANDGQGTNILKKLTPSSFTIAAKEAIEKIEPLTTEETGEKKDTSTKKTKTITTTTITEADSVDNLGPSFEINRIESLVPNRASFVFSGSDSSGISYYEFQLDNAAVLKVADDGTNIYNTPALSVGDHILLATAIDKVGNRTKRQLNFAISLPIANSLWVDWGGTIITVLSIAVPIIALIIALIIILMLGGGKVLDLKRKLRREVREVEDKMHEAFDLIRDDLQTQVAAIEKAKTKRKLTTLEKKLFKTIKGDLTETEKYLKREIQDIEKEIN